MTVYVAEGADTVLTGLTKMKNAMIEDYTKFSEIYANLGDDLRKKMCAEFADGFTITYGKKYIKIHEKSGGVKAFVVGVDNDKKFKKGDILKPAGWAAPARNKARGNILDGNYAINWTGPLYLYRVCHRQGHADLVRRY